MYIDGQAFCLGLFVSLLHKIGSCSIVYFLCCYAITVRVYLILSIVMHISILEVCRFLVWFYRKHVVVITRWCNFRQQRSVLTQF